MSQRGGHRQGEPAGAGARAQRLPCGLVVAAAGAAVLLGWLLDVPLLKSISPSWVTMKANTALGFVLSGLALANLGRPSRLQLVRLCAGAVILLSALTLAEHVAGRDLHIDQLLVREPLDAVGTSAPGRMAPTTAAALTLSGAALLLASGARAVVASQGLAILVVLAGLLPLTGYCYGATQLLGIGQYTQMAVHTAALFVVLGLGLLGRSSHQGLFGEVNANGPGGWLWHRTLTLATIGPLLLGWLQVTGERRQYYESPLGTALHMVWLAVALTALLWWAARELNRLDLARARSIAASEVSDDRFRLLVDTMSSVVWVTDAAGAFAEPQAEWEAYTGQSWAEHRGHGWAQALHPEDRNRIRAEWQAALLRGEGYRTEGRLWCAATNDYHAVMVQAAPRCDAAGQVLEWIGCIQDVQDRLSLATAAAEHERVWRLTVGLAPFPIIVHAEDGEVIAISRGWTMASGYTHQDIPTMADWTAAAFGRDGPRMSELVDRLYDLDEMVQEGEFAIRTKGGEARLWEFASAPLGRLSDGRRTVISMASDVTERKRLEEELRQLVHALTREKELADTIIDALPGVFAVVDASGRLRRWNANFETVTGRATAELLGLDVRELFLREDATRVTEGMATAISVGQSAVEVALRHVDGTATEFLFTGRRLEVDGQVCVVGLGVEIGSRKAMEADLRLHRDQLETLVAARTTELAAANAYNRGLLEASLDLMVTIDRDGLITDANTAAESFTGYPPEALIGTEFATHFTAPDLARHGYRAVFETGRVQDYELQLRHADGTTRPVLFNATVYLDQAGQVAGVLAAARDVTALREAEAELRAREQRQRRMLDQLAVGIVLTTGPEQRVLYHNPRCVEFFGYSIDDFPEVADWWPRAYPDPEYRAWVADEWHRRLDIALRDQTDIEPMEVDITARDGTVKRMLVHTVVIDEFLLTTFVDLTALRAAEHQVVQLNLDLVRRAEELEAANKELEAFSYSVSHDLKAPLRSIDGYAGFLEEDYGDQLDDEGRRLLGVIRESAREMGELVNDLLAFSRLSRTPLNMVPLDLAAMVDDIWPRVTADCGDRRLELRRGAVPQVMGDPTTIREVLTNLLANAVKFTARREIAVIEVAGRQHDGEVEIEVRDNGAGFDMAYADKLFGVFQRLHGQDEFEGTGIGLALVQRIVHRHGGRVWGEGEVGRGAAFHFTLPPVAADGVARGGASGGHPVGRGQSS